MFLVFLFRALAQPRGRGVKGAEAPLPPGQGKQMKVKAKMKKYTNENEKNI